MCDFLSSTPEIPFIFDFLSQSDWSDLVMDSSSSLVPNRDGNAGDDDGILSVTYALAKDAALYFQSRKFYECVDVLNQLKLKKEDDPKVNRFKLLLVCMHWFL